jgi:hypothetical protein
MRPPTTEVMTITITRTPAGVEVTLPSGEILCTEGKRPIPAGHTSQTATAVLLAAQALFDLASRP